MVTLVKPEPKTYVPKTLEELEGREDNPLVDIGYTLEGQSVCSLGTYAGKKNGRFVFLVNMDRYTIGKRHLEVTAEGIKLNDHPKAHLSFSQGFMGEDE